MNQFQKQQCELLTPTQLAKRLHVPRGTVDRLTKDVVIPPILIEPGTIRYDWDEVVDALKTQCRGAGLLTEIRKSKATIRMLTKERAALTKLTEQIFPPPPMR